MFKKIRVVILLSILLFVALGEFLAARRSTSWDDTLWVDVYLVNGDHLDSTQRYVDSIDAKEFAGVAEFFAAEAKRYGIKIEQPFRLNVVGEYHGDVPTPGAHPSLLGTMWWSLEMRWLALELDWQSSGPRPDIVAFAIYHNSAASAVLDRSTALRKGLIAEPKASRRMIRHATRLAPLAPLASHSCSQPISAAVRRPTTTLRKLSGISACCSSSGIRPAMSSAFFCGMAGFSVGSAKPSGNRGKFDVSEYLSVAPSVCRSSCASTT